MTDDQLQKWWPDLGIVAKALRHTDQPSVADLIVRAVQAGATSTEILGGVGAVLREHYALRSQLNSSAARAWDAVMADVHRAFPGTRLTDWFVRLKSHFHRYNGYF